MNKISRIHKRVNKKPSQRLIKIKNKKEYLDNKKAEKIKNGLPVFKGFFGIKIEELIKLCLLKVTLRPMIMVHQI